MTYVQRVTNNAICQTAVFIHLLPDKLVKPDSQTILTGNGVSRLCR